MGYRGCLSTFFFLRERGLFCIEIRKSAASTTYKFGRKNMYDCCFAVSSLKYFGRPSLGACTRILRKYRIGFLFRSRQTRVRTFYPVISDGENTRHLIFHHLSVGDTHLFAPSRGVQRNRDDQWEANPRVIPRHYTPRTHK